MIHCPYCNHPMDLKGAHAGRFYPRCTRCREKFELIIDAQGNAQALSIKKSDPGETLSPAIAAALGLEDAGQTTPPPAARQSGPARTVGRSQAAQTVAPPSRPIGAAASATPTLAPTPASPASSPPAVGLDAPADTMPPVDRSFDAGADASATDAQTLPPPGDEPLPGTRLGGYELVQKLGQGGMGSVFLARQLSLDRHVALKVLLAQLAADAQFVARFTREAYAAAQLNHHNVVQIHDIGAQKQTHFFSMEYVEGMTLASLVKQEGPLPAEVAAGYILQAARGLKFAHDHGMVHRDVKPDNLLLSRHGIVKVADLGLVKTPGAKHEHLTVQGGRSGEWYGEQTQVNVSMGTPAYMAPEQAQDAAHVDARADIYSLGCSLYTLLTGRPPFVGRSVMEIVNKHLKEPVQPPGLLVEYVPSALSDIVMKMLAKKPEARYQDMEQVIRDLEAFLGQETAGPYAPKQEHIKILENCSKWFADSSWARIRRISIRAFFPVCALALVTLLFALPDGPAKAMWLQGVLGFAVLTPLSYLVIQGVLERTHLLLKARELIFGARLLDWAMWLAGGAIVVWLLVVLDMHWPWLLAALAGAAAATGFYFAVDPQIVKQRRQPLERIQAMLKQLREKGVSEPALQQFVCQQGGEEWEELYEWIFGYEAKLLARERWNKIEALARKGKGDPSRPRPKYAAWRDPVLRWIDAKLRVRREARDRKHLEKVELHALVAQGLPETVARKKAQRVAVSLVVKAADLREQAMDALTEPPKPQKTLPPPGQKQPEREKGSVDEDEDRPRRRRRKHALAEEGLEDWERLSYFQRRYGGVGGLILGSSVRFGLGAVLLIGAILWVSQNRINPAEQLTGVVGVVTDQAPRLTEAAAARTGAAVEQAVRPRETRPVSIEPIPEFITRWFNGWHVAIAGLLLVVSTFFEGNKLGWFLVPAAALIFAGPTALGHIQYAGIGSIALGLLVGVLALQFARE